MPSEVNVGGMRTSTTTRSGRWRSTATRNVSASGQASATSKPPAVSNRTRPSRSRTESSAMTTRSVDRGSGVVIGGLRRVPTA